MPSFPYPETWIMLVRMHASRRKGQGPGEAITTTGKFVLLIIVLMTILGIIFMIVDRTRAQRCQLLRQAFGGALYRIVSSLGSFLGCS